MRNEKIFSGGLDFVPHKRRQRGTGQLRIRGHGEEKFLGPGTMPLPGSDGYFTFFFVVLLLLFELRSAQKDCPPGDPFAGINQNSREAFRSSRLFLRADIPPETGVNSQSKGNSALQCCIYIYSDGFFLFSCRRVIEKDTNAVYNKR